MKVGRTQEGAEKEKRSGGMILSWKEGYVGRGQRNPRPKSPEPQTGVQGGRKTGRKNEEKH